MIGAIAHGLEQAGISYTLPAAASNAHRSMDPQPTAATVAGPANASGQLDQAMFGAAAAITAMQQMQHQH